MPQHTLLTQYLGAVISWLGFIAVIFFYAHRPPFLSNFPIEKFTAANSTLGFGAIAAVSRAASSRREGLIFAANITRVHLTIPEQPIWTEEDVAGLHAKYGSTMTHGSSLAWLGHLHALKWFLSTDLQSILILEDDVDWDIRLRSIQIPAAAAAVRLLANPHHSSETDFWGPLASWDLLYLGHCGDFFPSQRWKGIPHLTFPDSTLPVPENLHPYTQKFLSSIDIPAQNRLVHQTTFPLCTFGYAVTRASAKRLVHELANREPDGGCLAYDIRIHEICRDNPDFKCLTVNPELMHHVDAESEIGNVDQGREHGQQGIENTTRRHTPNIACGARSPALYTDDPDVLNYLASHAIGDAKTCLPEDMEAVEREMRMRYPYA
ncbi:glycosyltransferase family 25 protein [Pseudocercospora fijiensis CIRAD86]|uniref:Glycosyltransferase family 25 protein n=1 Tax=Pseudocercospora fijiensis (strain CIRAD86) TaxID=383855 RepID=M3AC47_PSEFD|nr:glycosyltransferase family 25 protein [Pseudocercospora fijiensis CIRAD86]EME82136.1 glycosyltransferase family 25 protein [Pseudocercospora fijiensis CIRAD86]